MRKALRLRAIVGLEAGTLHQQLVPSINNRLWQFECRSPPPHDQPSMASLSDLYARNFSTTANPSASHEASNPQTASSADSPAHIQQQADGSQNPKPDVRVASLPADIHPSQIQQQQGLGGVGGKKDKLMRREEAAASFGGIPLPLFEREGVDGVGRGEMRVGTTGGSGDKAKEEAVSLMEGIRRVRANARAKFNETVEVHVKLGVDPRRSDMTVRGSAVLPHGSGKLVRVAVFADGSAAEDAAAAGADVVGGEELIKALKDGEAKLNFDRCIAHPAMMPRLSQIARLLGPRGLMPNPKMGTVTSNVAEAVKQAKRGRADFRADKTGVVHVGIGKVNFSDNALHENAAAFAAALLAAKPVGLKKSNRLLGYCNSITLSSTMGPGVRVSVPSVSSALDAYTR